MKKLIGSFLCAIGLSAHAQFMAITNTATLSWNAVADPNLAGYQLFYWTGILTNAVSVPQSQLSVRVLNLNWASTYTIAVKAVAQQGTNTLVSSFSAPVTLITPQAPPPPLLPPPAPTGLRIIGP